MAYETGGFDELQHHLENLTDGMNALGGDQRVPILVLFSDAFMAEHTNTATIQAFLDNSGFDVGSRESLAAIPDGEMDRYVSANTDFASWQEMLQAAVAAHVRNQLGL